MLATTSKIFVRRCIYVSAKRPTRGPPEVVKPFIFATARNLLIDRVRKEQVVPIDAVSDLGELRIANDTIGPERTVIARDEPRANHDAREHFPLNRLSGERRGRPSS